MAEAPQNNSSSSPAGFKGWLKSTTGYELPRFLTPPKLAQKGLGQIADGMLDSNLRSGLKKVGAGMLDLDQATSVKQGLSDIAALDSSAAGAVGTVSAATGNPLTVAVDFILPPQVSAAAAAKPSAGETRPGSIITPAHAETSTRPAPAAAPVSGLNPARPGANPAKVDEKRHGQLTRKAKAPSPAGMAKVKAEHANAPLPPHGATEARAAFAKHEAEHAVEAKPDNRNWLQKMNDAVGPQNGNAQQLARVYGTGNSMS